PSTAGQPEKDPTKKQTAKTERRQMRPEMRALIAGLEKEQRRPQRTYRDYEEFVYPPPQQRPPPVYGEEIGPGPVAPSWSYGGGRAFAYGRYPGMRFGPPGPW